MKNYVLTGVLLLFILSFTGCSEDPVPTEPEALKTSSSDAVTTVPESKSEGFATPLFGLATIPNGDILVADAGAGITDATGTIKISLPGVTDIGPLGNSSLWATTGAAGGEEGAVSDTGQGLHRVSNGNTKLIANLFAFEEAHDPDGAGVDSNPFGVASLGGNSALVVDAGGNDLLRVDNQGTIEVIAVFPDELVSTANLQGLIGCPDPIAPDLAFICDIPEMPAQAVPTAVAVGPDGYYYVGELKGFPAPAGASNIWKISPDASGEDCGNGSHSEKLFDGGFTSIIDLVFCQDGKLYVAELDEQSWFAVEVFGGGAGGSISAINLETLEVKVVASGIPGLTAITFGKDGRLWATTHSLNPELAEVIEIPL